MRTAIHRARPRLGGRSRFGKVFRSSQPRQTDGPDRQTCRGSAAAKLIRAFLNAGVMENGLVSPSVEETPQGGPLSPLLSNLVLDQLDRELERRGHRFVRYADDCNIYVRSERAGQRVMKSITHFITRELKLKVNEAKSAVARPQERKFVGSASPKVQRSSVLSHPRSLERFKQRFGEMARQAKGASMKTIMAELASYMRGWRAITASARPLMCCNPSPVGRGRGGLRAALWRQWKTPRRRRAELLARGVPERLASNTASCGYGPWRVIRTRALTIGLSTKRFLPMARNCAPWSRSDGPTSRTAMVRTRMPGGVGGAEPRGSPLPDRPYSAMTSPI